jgi:hypothetical protein
MCEVCITEIFYVNATTICVSELFIACRKLIRNENAELINYSSQLAGVERDTM